MGKNEFELSVIFPATAEEIFDGWLSSEGHAAFTGNQAKVEGGSGGKWLSGSCRDSVHGLRGFDGFARIFLLKNPCSSLLSVKSVYKRFNHGDSQ